MTYLAKTSRITDDIYLIKSEVYDNSKSCSKIDTIKTCAKGCARLKLKIDHVISCDPVAFMRSGRQRVVTKPTRACRGYPPPFFVPKWLASNSPQPPTATAHQRIRSPSTFLCSSSSHSACNSTSPSRSWATLESTEGCFLSRCLTPSVLQPASGGEVAHHLEQPHEIVEDDRKICSVRPAIQKTWMPSYI